MGTYLEAEAADGLAVLERLLGGNGGGQLDEVDAKGVESLGTVILERSAIFLLRLARNFSDQAGRSVGPWRG